MKKRSKSVSALLISAIMLVSLLSSCTGTLGEVNVNEDGSGTIQVKVGVTEEGLKAISEQMGQSYDSSELAGYEQFNHNGNTYYGQTLTNEFSKPENLSFEFMEETKNNGVTASSSMSTDYGDVKLTRVSDGFNLSITVTPDEQEELTPEELELAEKLEYLKDSVSQVLTFNMPGEVTQTKGTTAGVTISGKSVTLDYIAMQESSNTALEFSIKSSTTGTTDETVPPDTTNHSKTFSDVIPEQWYYKAVTEMAQVGLVNGYGTGEFGPSNSISINEFCEILSRAAGMATGPDGSGWWAGRAVESCVQAGYIQNRGEINANNYGALITREEAIAALQRASSGYTNVKHELSLSNIPDSADISPEYRADIVDAYRAGISTGVDGTGKFAPKKNLSRAEVCQMFYNLPTVFFIPEEAVGAGSSYFDMSVYTKSLTVGSKAIILVTGVPNGEAASAIVWESADTSVASIDKNGVITGISSGTATITATYNGKTLSCVVAVTG